MNASLTVFFLLKAQLRGCFTFMPSLDRVSLLHCVAAYLELSTTPANK